MAADERQDPDVPSRIYRIYIVELDDAVLRCADVRERNPHHTDRRGCLYVGQTAKDPDLRFDQHKQGGRLASRKVRDHGVRLRPDLYKHIPPLESRGEAEEREGEVARALQEEGWVVWWN